MKQPLFLCTLLACTFLAFSSQAQVTTVTTETITTTPITESGYINDDVQIYAGPGYSYPEVAYLPNGENMEIYGCIEGYSWCDVSAAGIRGWIAGDNLYLHPYEQPIIHYGPRLTVLPIVVFNRDNYWNHWYRSRPFYHTWYADHPRPKVIYTAPIAPRQAIIHHERPIIRDNVVIHDHPAIQPVIRRPVVVEHPVVRPAPAAIIAHPTPASPVVHQEIRHEEHHNVRHDSDEHRDGNPHDGNHDGGHDGDRNWGHGGNH